VKFEPAPVVRPPPNAADRLVSVDPVMAYQREQLGRPPSTTYAHPEQYDAVLRAHLGMASPPDPYETQRRATANWQAIRDQKVL
jgi:hypothetical protein